jgi:hypothetical protein
MKPMAHSSTPFNILAWCRLDAALGCALAVTDFSMVYGGPVYVCAGLTLILGVSCLYLTAVFLPVYATRGWPLAAAHLTLGATLLGNILFNYILCITTNPGNTSKAVKEVCTRTRPIAQR